MRGPYNSDVWKQIESYYPYFANESRSLHFMISIGVVNQFGIKFQIDPCGHCCLGELQHTPLINY